MGVLDDMTRGITDRKAVKSGPKLTPVGAEVNPLKPSLASVKTEASFPNDVPADVLREVIADIDRSIAKLTEAKDALVTHVGEREQSKPEKKAAAAEAQAKEEKTADEKFAADFASKKKAAQEAVFASDAQPTKDSPTITPTSGWVCPEHGAEDIEHMTSRLRPAGYMACAVAGCGEFQPKE